LSSCTRRETGCAAEARRRDSARRPAGQDPHRPQPASPGSTRDPALRSCGYVALTLTGFRDHFAQDLPADEIALLHATQGPYNQGSNDEKISTAAWRSKPTWLVIGEQDHMLLADLEEATAKKLGAKTLLLASGHVPMLS
jgi:pimeloyl-ACP methyl ester carboxylesterase